MIFLLLIRPTARAKKQAIAICSALSVISLFMYISFLFQGYGLFSIIFSTLHGFIQYWAIYFIYKQIKNSPYVPKSAYCFIMGGLFSLLLSSFGPYILAYVSVAGMKESAIYNSAINLYLHFQSNGWLILFIIGCFLIMLHSKKIPYHTSMIITGFWIYFISLFPSYISNILWIENISFIFSFISGVGLIAQWVGTIVICISFDQSLKELKSQYSKRIIILLIFIFYLFIIKSTMNLGLISPELSVLIYETRNVIIGYLHLILLGFISMFILLQFQMLNILRNSIGNKIGWIVLLIGFLLNEFLLFYKSLCSWLQLKTVPFTLEGLFLASILLTSGILILWFSSKKFI